MSLEKNITIIGDGGYGTAVALVLNSAGHKTTIWSYDPQYVDEMRRTHENVKFLPGYALPPTIEFETDLSKAIRQADLIMTAVPSKFLRSVLSQAKGAAADRPVVSLTKGFDADTLMRPTEVIRDCLGAEKIIALSGPSSAGELAQGLPASVVVAADELETARRVQGMITSPRFRVYASRDIVGVELAGAMKNVIALAAGILQGMKQGDNALAALVTRGLAEITRLGVAMGAEASTFSGLAGMGDLILTCITPHSRNRQVGLQLAEGKRLDDILAGMNGVPESVSTTELVLKLADKYGVDMPIACEVADVLWRGKAPQTSLDELMRRESKDEN